MFVLLCATWFLLLRILWMCFARSLFFFFFLQTIFFARCACMTFFLSLFVCVRACAKPVGSKNKISILDKSRDTRVYSFKRERVSVDNRRMATTTRRNEGRRRGTDIDGMWTIDDDDGPWRTQRSKSRRYPSAEKTSVSTEFFQENGNKSFPERTIRCSMRHTGGLVEDIQDDMRAFRISVQRPISHRRTDETIRIPIEELKRGVRHPPTFLPVFGEIRPIGHHPSREMNFFVAIGFGIGGIERFAEDKDDLISNQTTKDLSEFVCLTDSPMHHSCPRMPIVRRGSGDEVIEEHRKVLHGIRIGDRHCRTSEMSIANGMTQHHGVVNVVTPIGPIGVFLDQ